MRVRSALALLALVACSKSTPAPAPTASPVAMPSATASVATPPAKPVADAAAIALAERPATTLTQLWTKRVATAYLAHELLLEQDAVRHMEHALQDASLDEELAALRALDAVAPVFEDVAFSHVSRGAKSPVPEGRFWTQIKAEEDAKRIPIYVALYRKLGPKGRFNLAVYHGGSDDPLLKAMLGVTREDHVCPLPLHEGMKGFDRYSAELAAISCPAAKRPMPTEPYGFDPTGEPGEGEPLTKCVAAAVRAAATKSVLPREQWFPEYRANRIREACASAADDLVEKPSQRELIARAFAEADVETRAALLPALLRSKNKLAPADLEALAADPRTRSATHYALQQEGRLASFPRAHATVPKLDEGELIAWVRWFFGSVPDEIAPLPSLTRAKDGKATKLRFYRFRASAPKDNAGLGTFDFALGDETGTNWDPKPDGLRDYLAEHIHDGRSVSLFENDR